MTKITSKRQLGGFSLIEILVCLGIIAIICAITFPVFAAAKQSAKRTTVKNGLHQMYLALALYRQDHEGTELQGSSSDLGLPNVDQLYFHLKSIHFTYPRFVNRLESGPIYYPVDKSDCSIPEVESFCLRKLDRWNEYNGRMLGNSVILGDFQFTGLCQDYLASTCIKSGDGVNLVGSLVSKKNAGSVSEGYWWIP